MIPMANAEEAVEAKSTASERGSALAATRQAKLKEFFDGKKFEFLKAVELPAGQNFVTPFGNKGRKGFAYQEVGNEANRFILGESQAERVAAEYPKSGITVPEKTRKRRTAEEKAAAEAEKAEKKAAAQAEAAALTASILAGE